MQAILQNAILILFFVTSAVLILLILIQSGKGGSVGIFGGGGSSSAFGSSTVDVVQKATMYAGVVFFGLAVLAAVAFADKGPEIKEEPKTEAGAGQQPGADKKPLEGKDAAGNPPAKDPVPNNQPK